MTLPGGYGMLDELAEVLTLAQLGLQQKACGLLDVAGFFTPLLAYLDYAVAERFLRPEHRQMLLAEEDPDRLLDSGGDPPAAPGGQVARLAPALKGQGTYSFTPPAGKVMWSCCSSPQQTTVSSSILIPQ